VPAVAGGEPPSRLARLALAVAGLALAWGAAEGALRLAGISYPNFYQADAERGWALRPGAEGWYRREGGAWVRINRDGLRDREHALAKPPGTLRIAVLGDSMAEALQVPQEETFWSLLPGALATCPALAGRSVETLDFGVSGYGTAQELLTLDDRAWRYDPDIVLLTVYTGNDIRNNYRPLEQDPLRPYFTLEDGRLRLDDAFRREAAFRFRRGPLGRLAYFGLDHSRLLQLVKRAQVALATRRVAARQHAVEGNEVLGELGLDNAVYSPPADDDWRQAWAVTEALVRRMGDDVAAHGARLAVATLSDGIQVDPRREVREKLMRRLGVDGLFYADLRIERLAQGLGLPALALAPPMLAWAEQSGEFLHGFANTPPGTGHYNRAGHAEVARLLAPWLCSELIAPAARPAPGD
jgi:lysophospholipase L1-like esterase